MSKADSAAGESAEVVAIEQALMGRAKAGDREAQRTLLTRYAPMLYAHVILPRIGDAATAEDILRTTMLKAVDKLSTFRWQGRSPYFWLRQIAANSVIDHHRARQRGRRLAEALAHEEEATAPRRPGPEAALIAAEEQRINRERIAAALDALNPRYRQAIELRLIQELPREACAERLDVTVGTFDVLIFRAVRAFRRAFGER